MKTIFVVPSYNLFVITPSIIQHSYMYVEIKL